MNQCYLDGFKEWSDMSVFLEMKPKSELGSMFIDVPPEFRPKSTPVEGDKKIKYNDIDVVNITDKSIRIGAPPTARVLINRERLARGLTKTPPVPIKKAQPRERTTSASSSCSASTSPKSASPKSPSASPKSGQSTPTKSGGNSRNRSNSTGGGSEGGSGKKGGKKGGKEKKDTFTPFRYGASLNSAKFEPKTVTSPTWGQNCPRLFLCKVQITNDKPLVHKTLRRIAEDICKKEKLEAFAARGNPRIICSRCSLNFLSDEYIMKIGVLPDDEWLATTQTADFYCRDSCGPSCDPDKHKHGKTETKNIETKVAEEWLPHEKRVMISYANSTAHISSVLTDNVKVEGQVLKCAGCKCQIGKIQKNHPDLYCFNHFAAPMTSGPKKVRYLEKSFYPISLYMSQLILNSCETQSSLKLVFRSLEKVPYMLVWLLDSYVVLANGTLKGLRSEEDDGAILTPFPAIKLLYKIFNNSTASSDPRANGADTSAGLVDVALPCIEILIQMLLKSSLCLPIPCRAVGQFFVGYFPIADQFSVEEKKN